MIHSHKAILRWTRGHQWFAVVGFVLCSFGEVLADEGVEFFEKKIRPVLAKNCQGCHPMSLRWTTSSMPT